MNSYNRIDTHMRTKLIKVVICTHMVCHSFLKFVLGWEETSTHLMMDLSHLSPTLVTHVSHMFQVHKVHKYTYFEKLLANVEATFTFVQASA